MKKTAPIFLRLVLIGGIAAGGYYFYNHQSPPLPEQLKSILGAHSISLKNLSLPQNVLDQTKEKLTQSQPIVQNQNPSPAVAGASTTVSAGAQQLVNSSINQINLQLQNLPKQEAAKILRQACDQVAKELEK